MVEAVRDVSIAEPADLFQDELTLSVGGKKIFLKKDQGGHSPAFLGWTNMPVKAQPGETT